MREKNSVFKRYFSIYAVTLLICTFMLGVALLYFASQYFRDDNRTSLSACVEKGLEATLLNLDKNNGVLVRGEVEEEFALIERVSGATIFFSDVDGRVEICSEGAGCAHMNIALPEKVRNALLANGDYFDTGSLGGFFKSEGRYSYGRTVEIGGVVYGYVFASTALGELFNFLYQVTLMFLFSSLITLVASFFIIYYATRMLTRPLSEISAAAEAFGEGDFSARVTVTGNDEIGRLGDVFNRMAASVSELEMTRRSFVANVSHELRTPMTTIAGYIDGILDGTIPPKDRDRYLEIVTDEVKRLARLTSSLLDIARMEAGEQEANIASYNVWDIVLNVMWNAERRIEEKGILIHELDVEPHFALCDEDMLHQVIYNLLDNAIKFTPEGGEISVEVAVGDEMTDIRVRNTGSSIEEEDLAHVFERFYKSDKSRGLDKTGTGLGLYIVKTLVTRMDGNIYAESVSGEYTEFIVSLRNGEAQQVRPLPRRGAAGADGGEKQKGKTERERERESFVERITRGFRKDDGAKDGKGKQKKD